MKQNPLLIPEITRLLCSFVDSKDLLNTALTCKIFYHASCFQLWKTLNPKSNRALRQIKNTLDTTTNYNKYVWKFCFSAKYIQLECLSFNSFLFPNLRELVFSNVAAQDHIVRPIISAAQKSLSALDLSQCYCISTSSIQPLLTMAPNQLRSLVLYGCGKIDAHMLASVIRRHANTLERIGLTDINDTILDAIYSCTNLNDLGLEHCTTLTNAALTRFFINVVKNNLRMSHLRLRDIDNLTSSHLKLIAASASCLSLMHIDMSECNKVKSDDVCWLARQCVNLTSLSMAYQAGVTNQALQVKKKK
ncbi:hypothetical protein BD560DRAFT_124010 [Blakeslea trispora]|nr:hypothetical protein BD560DRAFT_124010 [Blakeslea trispora]